MGGQIDCSSRLGEGTTFSLEIPFEPVETKTGSPVKPIAPRSDGKLSFLIVDDEPRNRETIEMLLGTLGHHATSASSWIEANAHLESAHVDVVLLDLQMPEMSGYEMLGRIRSLPLTNPPSVIALTGDATSATRQKTVAAGFTEFLAKPFRVANLLQLVESLGTNRAA